MTEDGIRVGWHHQLNGHEFVQAPGDDEGKPGVLQFIGLKESHTTERLNNNKSLQEASHKRCRLHKIQQVHSQR